MDNMMPTPEEIGFLIQKFWREDRDLSRRARADNLVLLNLRVQLTQQLMERLIEGGLLPVEAERQALREVGFVD